jgi:hypothetical protein
MDRRRPYQRPEYYWQSKRPGRRKRSISIRDWVLIAIVGFAGLSALFGKLGNDGASSGSTSAPQSLISSSTYYRNCDAARADGAAPLNAGDPGYRSELDRDSDGVACEPYYGN